MIITEEPTGYKAIVVDNYEDAWQRSLEDTWNCAVDGDTFQNYSWRSLVREFGPITLISAGDPGDTDPEETA